MAAQSMRTDAVAPLAVRTGSSHLQGPDIEDMKDVAPSVAAPSQHMECSSSSKITASPSWGCTQSYVEVGLAPKESDHRLSALSEEFHDVSSE